MSRSGLHLPMRVQLIDGTWELFRAHFAPRPPHLTPQGRNLSGTVGVVQSLLSLLDDPQEGVTHIAAAFDNPIRSFRNDLFDGYKSDDGIDPVLRTQFDDVEQGVAALGITVWSMKEFEADDALASGAAVFSQDPRVTQVQLMTPDKDLGQCLRGDAVVQFDRMRRRLITETSLRTERGLAPQSVPDYLALVGDTSDGIPGLDHWGEKSALEVLAAYPHLEDIPPRADQWRVKVRSAAKLSASLEAGRAAATLYRTLATLRADAPVGTVDSIEWRGVPRARFSAWCDQVGLPELKTKPRRWAKD